MSSSRWRLSAESITAAAAVLTAIIALSVGVWQTAETRRHNRLSVRPLLDFTTMVAASLPDSLNATIEVANRGLGLAELEGMEIQVLTRSGGQEVFDGWTAAVPTIEAYGVTVGSRADLGGRTLMEPGDSAIVLELMSTGGVPIDSLIQILQRIDVAVTYRSLYDEPYTVHRRDPEGR